MSIFKSKVPPKECLICADAVGDNPSEVRYKYQDGEGVAYLCKKCSDSMNKDKVDSADGEEDVDYGESI
jgi:hypothetical protein